MKRKFYTTQYLEDGQYHFGIKSNRPFFVGKTQSDCQGDEHVMYIVTDTPSHLTDFDISIVDSDTLKRTPYFHYGYHNPKETTRIAKSLVKMGYDVEDHSYSNDESDKLGINGRYCLIMPTEVYPLFQLYPYTNEHCEEIDYSQEPQSFKSINQINL
jgi:hypothetical protein